MRVIIVATVLSAISLVINAASNADEHPTDRVRDLVAETAKMLNNEEVSPDEKAAAIERLRDALNQSRPGRERPEAPPNDRQPREREMDRQRQDRVIEGLDQARREFDEALRRLESIPRREFENPTPRDRRGESFDRGGEQPNRRDFGPPDQRDGRPMEPPRMPDRSAGDFPNRQAPRFEIGIAFVPSDRESGEGIVVGRVMERSPADEAGLRNGDILIAADNENLRDPQQLAGMVQKAGQEGRDIQLKVRRNDENLELSLRPRLSNEPNFPPGFGAISAWEMIPGQPPILGNPFPPRAMPFPVPPHAGEIESLRREMEAMQRKMQSQIDDLRNQMNQRGEKPRSTREPAAEDI